MSRPYDVAVIGAGHNGLTAAALLARRGRRVVVLEKRKCAGGLAASEEFAPGYCSAGVLHETEAVRPWVVQELGLERYGLEPRREEEPLFVPDREGRGLVVWRDSERAAEEFAASGAAEDSPAYGRYRSFLERLRPVVRKIFDEPPADLEELAGTDLWALGRRALALRLLGREDMMELLRIAPMSAGDWLREWFETELVCAALSGPAATLGGLGPWSPGGTLHLLLAETLAGKGFRGGPAALARALEAAAAAAGVEIRTGSEVARVDLEGDRVVGVTLADGSAVAATVVAAACDPKTLFLGLLPPRALGIEFEREIGLFRTRGVTAKIDLALSGYPRFACRPDHEAIRIRTGDTLDHIERAADAVKYRQASPRPVLDIFVPTLEDPGLAPPGHHVLSVLAHWAPYGLEGGWSDDAKERLSVSVLEALEEVAPGVGRLKVAERVASPVDLERWYGPTGGHLFHGEHAPDQLLTRPAAECARYRTPFAGLYLCGSGSHPGGGITCAPGALAARSIV